MQGLATARRPYGGRGRRQGNAGRLRALIGVVELADLHGLFIERVEQARVNAHFAEILPKGLPVRAAAANGAMVDADHAITPDIGGRFPCNFDLIRGEIGDAPCQPTTERTITVRHPFWLAWQLDPDVSAMAASVNAHHASLLRFSMVRHQRAGGGYAFSNHRIEFQQLGLRRAVHLPETLSVPLRTTLYIVRDRIQTRGKVLASREKASICLSGAPVPG